MFTIIVISSMLFVILVTYNCSCSSSVLAVKVTLPFQFLVLLCQRDANFQHKYAGGRIHARISGQSQVTHIGKFDLKKARASRIAWYIVRQVEVGMLRSFSRSYHVDTSSCRGFRQTLNPEAMPLSPKPPKFKTYTSSYILETSVSPHASPQP